MLTNNQEKFVQCIVEGKSQIEAYKEAYPKQRCADKTCYENASRLMANSKVQARLTDLRNQLAKPSILTAQERLEYLTRVIKGEETEKVVQILDGERVETDIPISTRTKLNAVDIMNKMSGEYTQKVEASVTNAVNICIELSDD